MIWCSFNTRLLRVRAEDHCNPCLHIKDRPDIWPAINRVAGCHLPRCLACGLRFCQMGIMRPQDAFQEASEAPKLQGQACGQNILKKCYIFPIIIYQSLLCLPYTYVCCLMSTKRFHKAFFKRAISHLTNKVTAFDPDTFRSWWHSCLTFKF